MDNASPPRTTLLQTRANGDLVILTASGRILTISPGALAVAEAVGASIDADIDALIARLVALPIRDEESIAAIVEAFREECLEGADPQIEDDWIAYAEVIARRATGPDDREPADQSPAQPVRCECGAEHGARCGYILPADEMVRVRWVPASERQSLRAAGHSGAAGLGCARILLIAPDDVDELIASCDGWAALDASVDPECVVDLDTPNGPTIEYPIGSDDSDVEAAAAYVGWRVDWEATSVLVGGGWRRRSPLVRDQLHDLAAAIRSSADAVGDRDPEEVAREWIAAGISADQAGDYLAAGCWDADRTAELIAAGVAADDLIRVRGRLSVADGYSVGYAHSNGDLSTSAIAAAIRAARE